ncbi:hypothetical protein FPQ18DRAFT_321182 [Pyronema domesticum]|nr:hypothetical protein FPQ18DRAFT_321182 [Pyronema domesticum]
MTMWSSVKSSLSWKTHRAKKKSKSGSVLGVEYDSLDVAVDFPENTEDCGIFPLGEQKPETEYEVDIIALHGLGGHWKNTWTDTNGKFWLRDYLPEKLINARVLSWGYNSYKAFTLGEAELEEAAKELLDGIEEARTDKTRPVVVIAHSLGGVLAKRAMILAHEKSQDYGGLLKCIHGIGLFGTPHKGADMEYWKQFTANVFKVSPLEQNSRLAPALGKNAELFKEISQKFVTRASALQIRSFYETSKTQDDFIVDEEAVSLGLPNEMVVAVMDSDHKSMCKFGNPKSQKYAPVERSMKKLANSAISSQVLTPAFLSQEEKDCLQYLDSTNYISHKERNPKPVDGTCEWILEHQRYQSWQNNEEKSSLLWISGDPGCGKSVLSTFLLTKLSDQYRPSPASPAGISEATVLHFFFTTSLESPRTAISALNAILHQLFLARPLLLPHLVSPYLNRGQGIFKDFPPLWSVFFAAISDPRCGNIFLILDGLDECDLETRTLLTGALIDFYAVAEARRDSLSSLKTIITSRNIPSISKSFSTMPSIRLETDEEAKNVNNDIAFLVTTKIKHLARKRGLTVSERFQLETDLNAKASGSFLWAALVLELIETSETPIKVVAALPDTLESLYAAILSSGPDVEVTRKMLHILLASTRPLTLPEMGIALSVSHSVSRISDLPVLDINQILQSHLGPLIRIISNRLYLCHQTLLNYLHNPIATTSPAMSQGLWKSSFHPIASNRVLAEICTTYLLLPDFATAPAYPLVPFIPPEEPAVKDFCLKQPLLDYAATYWVAHMQCSNISDSPHLLEAAIVLSDIRDLRTRFWLSAIRNHIFHLYFSDELNTDSSADLLLPTYLGLVDVVRHLLALNVDTEVKAHTFGATALHLAAARRVRAHLELPQAGGFHDYQIVRLILGAGADIEARRPGGENVIMEAVNYQGTGREVVELLENWGKAGTVSPEVKGPPRSEQEAIVRVLLEYGADVDKKDCWGETARSRGRYWAE